jgi:2-methylcitrate dehydratase PrpD
MLEYEALPSELVDLLKQCVLDTLGVATGASTLAPEAKLVADYVMDLGGKPESSILGFGGRAPAAWAAFATAASATCSTTTTWARAATPG